MTATRKNPKREGTPSHCIWHKGCNQKPTHAVGLLAIGGSPDETGRWMVYKPMSVISADFCLEHARLEANGRNR